MVCMLDFYSHDLGFNTAEAYIFLLILNLKGTKINKKRPGLAQFLKTTQFKSSHEHFCHKFFL